MDETYQSKEAKGDLNTCTSANGSDIECVNPDAIPDAAGNGTDSKDSISTAICLNDRDECPQFAKRGDCETNPTFMHSHCKFLPFFPQSGVSCVLNTKSLPCKLRSGPR